MKLSDLATIGVHVDGVSKRYAHRVKGEVYAARDVRLDVAPGEFVALLGPSGCGKTTTLRMIAGFEKPDAGTIRFGGQDVTHLPANQRNIGFVFQNYALFPHLSVFENVAYGLQVRGMDTGTIARNVADVLGLVGLAGYEHQFSGQLSGGEQQRVALARAIVIKPQVLLFDEPLSNLDARLRVQMRTEIRELQQRLGITAIYVTHDQEEAMAVADRIAVMNAGSVVQEGSAQDLYLRPTNEFVATFVGRVNLVPGRVSDVRDGVATVAALGGALRVHTHGASVAPGTAVKLVVRPEAISVQGEGEGTLPAQLVSHTFLGEKSEYVLRCGEQTLLAVRYSSGVGDAIAVGATVALRIAEHAVTVLPEPSP